MAPLFTGLKLGFGLGAEVAGIVLPAIGDAFEGGYYAGLISHTADGVATHALIVAPKASGSNGGALLRAKTSRSGTSGTDNLFDGAINSANMNNATHPAAQYCEGLTIGGYSDWYLPARYELDITYQNLKPTTTINDTAYGINPYSVPERTVNRTAGAPAQTSIAAFQSGGAEAFDNTDHWSSTEVAGNTENSFHVDFANGRQIQRFKDALLNVRAFRKIAL